MLRHFAILAIALCLVQASGDTWSFQDASLTVQAKKGGNPQRQEFALDRPVAETILLNAQDTLKLLLTTTVGSSPQRADQAFLHLEAPQHAGLETSFALQVKSNGKAKLELVELLHAAAGDNGKLRASLIIASFGPSNAPLYAYAFDLGFAADSSLERLPSLERYDRKAEIRHIFKDDPRSPPLFITLVFTAAVVFVLPLLLSAWIALGANLQHVSKALGDAALPHTLFFGSIVGLEAVFILYYSHWKLYQTLPCALGVGLVTFLSGIRALREVQQRRLAGHR